MSTAKELTQKTAQPIAQQPAAMVTPDSLLALAVQQGADLEKLEKLMDLKDRYERDQARKAFVQAMAEFKANPPEIFKTKHVKFNSTEYMHATIGDVTTAIIEGLSAHGFSHRWDLDQSSGIKVTCVLTHRLGHSESTVMTAPPDQSGGKNAIQAIASTITYLQRYTLLAATGLATQDMDDDGNAGDTDEERAARAAEQEKADREAFYDQYADSIVTIKEGIAENNLSRAAEAWYELTDDVKMKLWRATSKGGPFTPQEREIMKSSEFKKAHFGEQK